MPKKTCIAKILWESGTPYIQSGGWLAIFGLLCSIAWATFTFINNTQAAIQQVPLNTQNIQQLQQDVVGMKQKIDDIYDVVVRQRR